MNKIQIVTTGNQQEYLQNFLGRAGCGVFSEAAKSHEESFKRSLGPLVAGEKVAVYVTTYQELHQLNGLSCPVGGKEVWCNLAVPNFLAGRLGLEPIGHELGLEVFGQGLHHTALPQVENGFVICTISCNYEPSRWDDERKLLLSDPYLADAIRLEQKEYGHAQLYPTSHVARSGYRHLYLYKEMVER
ncbi:MAG TPA: hypothetical protein VJB70_01270 [Candidatus Paceibacterota bacterium]|nr:MAG: hypothetical protein UV62_C0023G0008 [Parcubacteria group bacterium GW2011_GWC1_43_11]